MVLATGVSYRRLNVSNMDRLIGAGVFYGASVVEAKAVTGRSVFVVGAGNSAGQAALHLARYAAHVTIVMRGESLAEGMSDYLVKEIAGRGELDSAPVHRGGRRARRNTVWRRSSCGTRSPRSTETRAAASALFVMIGAEPLTDWLADSAAARREGFRFDRYRPAQGGLAARRWPLHRLPLPMETSVPGVFAVGDVRCGSVKRVASAVGAGAIAIQFIHQYLGEALPVGR